MNAGYPSLDSHAWSTEPTEESTCSQIQPADQSESELPRISNTEMTSVSPVDKGTPHVAGNNNTNDTVTVADDVSIAANVSYASNNNRRASSHTNTRDNHSMPYASDTSIYNHIDSLFLQDLPTTAHDNRTIHPTRFRTPSPTPSTDPINPVPNTRVPHTVTHRPIRITEKEAVLLKRMRAFVEEYESLTWKLSAKNRDGKGNKVSWDDKYKRLVTGLDRAVQMHLKNGVPRVASSRARDSRKAGGEGGA